VDGDVAGGGAPAHLDGLVGLIGRVALSTIAVPRTTGQRATSPRRMLPLDVEVQIEQLAAP
jgi:hypothetical protein